MSRLTSTQIQQTRELAERAANCAMRFYHSDIQVTIKQDESPVTQADLAVSQLLEQYLPQIVDVPVLSEENLPDRPLWKDWETYWLIDPIDGTRHFINRTGEFCICIALIHNNVPVFGLISAPTTDEVWVGQMGTDDNVSFLEKYHNGQCVALPQQQLDKVTVTLGTRALSKRMKVLLSDVGEYDFYTRGSALKFIDLVEGRANIYPKMWDICEWDCAAGQCLLVCAGGVFIRFDSKQPILYGAQNSVLSPHFLAYRNLSQETVESVRRMYRHVPPHQG